MICEISGVMAWTVRETNPGGGEIFRTRPDWSRGPPSLLYNGYRFHLPREGGWSMLLTTSAHLEPRLKK
jgi:hypothetical protein